MGKIVTIYLSDDEARDLKEFCDENQCTRYSALKTAVRHLISKPIQHEEELHQEVVDAPQEITVESKDIAEEDFLEENIIGDTPLEERVEPTVEKIGPTQDKSLALLRLLRQRTKK